MNTTTSRVNLNKSELCLFAHRAGRMRSMCSIFTNGPGPSYVHVIYKKRVK